MEKKLDNSISEGHQEEEEAAIVKDLKKEELKTAIAEVTELRQENTRLKMLLQQLEKDYNSLQTRFEKRVSPTCTNTIEEGEIELVSLRLGLSPSQNEPKKDDKKRRNNDDGLKLGLDYNIEISRSGLERPISDSRPNKAVDAVAIDSGPTSEVSQARPNMKRASDDEVAQPNVKRARVSVRTKCDYPTINDGCQWRKYGQKVSRGNPCPRSYYRCSVAPLCPVRKQVQRCVEDMSILITTYEGTHNHSLPIEATAMASTTSAAASMILSGSSTSDQSLSNTQSLYLSNSTPNPNPFPTITLDLTTFPTTSSFTSFNFPSNFQSSGTLFSNSLSFSSPGSSRLPQISGNGYVNYGPTTTRPAHVQAQVNQQFLGTNNTSNKLIKEDSSSQLALTETLTKAITSDPSFQSVLAAAISSMVGATQT